MRVFGGYAEQGLADAAQQFVCRFASGAAVDAGEVGQAGA